MSVKLKSLQRCHAAPHGVAAGGSSDGDEAPAAANLQLGLSRDSLQAIGIVTTSFMRFMGHRSE